MQANARLRSLLAGLDRLSARGCGLAVLLVSVAARLGMVFFYQPVPYNDTPSYRRLADAILGGFAHYDGTRTPGYPLILAIFGADQRVWLAQMAMGLLISLALFYIGYQISGRAWFGGLVGLAHTLNPGQLFFEANLLTETATTFWVVLALAGCVLWIYHPPRRTPWLAAGIGLSASLAWLTRPLFIYLPFWAGIFLVLDFKTTRLRDYKTNLTRLAAYAVPVILLLGGWVGYIHGRYHTWSVSTMTGYNMVQHTGVFFEYVPDEYASLRDTYLKYRDAHIAQSGTQTNTIWDAIPEMQKVSHKSFYDLSKLLTRISIQLILAHPDLFARNLVQGWWYFWRAPVYWSPDLLRLGDLLPLVKSVVYLERLSLFGANLAFLFTSILAFFWRRARLAWQINPALWLLGGTVWIASVLQTILDHGDNPRFLVPLQSIVVLWVAWVAAQMLLSGIRKPV